MICLKIKDPPQRTDGLKTFKDTLKSLMFPLFGGFWMSNIFRHTYIYIYINIYIYVYIYVV